jgi:hypothetical protein
MVMSAHLTSSVKFPSQNDAVDNDLYAGAFAYRTKRSYRVNGDVYVRDVCESYDYLEDQYDFDYDVDSKWKTVKAFAIMTPIIGGIVMICSCFACCVPSVSPSLWKLAGMLFILMSLFQGLTLLIIRSNVCNDNPARNFLTEVSTPVFGEVFPEQCDLSSGFKLAISAVVFFFVAGVMALMMPSLEKGAQSTDGAVEEKEADIPQEEPNPKEEVHEDPDPTEDAHEDPDHPEPQEDAPKEMES